MPNYPYLTRAGKHGTWHYRRSVPAKLRPLIGAREIVKSLRTTVLADALAQYRTVAAEAEAKLHRAQAELFARRYAGAGAANGNAADANRVPPGQLQPADLQQRCEQHHRACQAAERSFREETTRRAANDPAAFLRGDIIDLPMPPEAFYALPQFQCMDDTHGAFKGLLAMAYRRRLEQRATVLRTMLATHDVASLSRLYNHCARCTRQVGFALAQTELRLFDDLLTDEAALVPAPVVNGRGRSQPQAPEGVGGGGPKLSQATADWIKAQSIGKGAWSAERRSLCQRVMADFLEVCGDKPIGGYRKSDGREFVRLLRRLPANIDKRKGALGFARQDLRKVAVTAEAKGIPPQDDSNVNKKIGIVHQCFRWIMSQYDECLASPVDGMKLASARNRKEEKEPFTTDQLNAMFAAPIFAGCASERHWDRPGPLVLRRSAKFWVPLIGMRSGEICQLTRAQVRGHQGVHYFALTGDLRLKNAASVRAVPIHQMLIACGFLEFVEASEGPLFPDLVQHASGRWSDAFGKHFARFLKSAGAKADGLDFHSLRHNFIAAADASGMEFAARERIVGHALQGQAGRYGLSYRNEAADMQLLLVRNRELQKLAYRGLKLDHLSKKL